MSKCSIFTLNNISSMSTAEEQTGFTVYPTQYSKDGGKINTIFPKTNSIHFVATGLSDIKAAIV